MGGVKLQVFNEWQCVYLAVLSLSAGALVAAVSSKTSMISLFEARKTEVQAIHRVSTPRLGSIGLLFAYGVAVVLFVPEPRPLFALLPLVVVALAEDIGLRISPFARLISVSVAASLQLFLFGFWIERVDVALLDPILGLWVIGVTLTVFAVTAISHSFNLVDGLNGLSAVCALAGSAGMALIARFAGLESESVLAAIIFVCVIGFLPLNFPKAYLFLGDTGAYLLGFLLSCVGIMLIAGSPEVSPWAVLLCVFWPIADTTCAIVRRLLKGAAISSPDREHMHHLAFDFVLLVFRGRKIGKFSNPVATLFLVPFIAAPPALGVLLWNQPNLALLCLGALAASYSLTYMAARKALKQVDERLLFQRPAE